MRTRCLLCLVARAWWWWWHRYGKHKVEVRSKVKYGYTAQSKKELSISPGEIVVVLKKHKDGWWKVKKMRGKPGLVPASYLFAGEDLMAV